MGLTLPWVQAEVHVDSQEISCYLNSNVWTSYKPSRENCLLYRALVYSLCSSWKSLDVEKPNSNSLMGERIRERSSGGGSTLRGSLSAGLVGGAGGGRCWTEVPLLHKVEGNWHYLAIPPLPSQSQKDSSIAICCLYKLKSVSWGKLCTQHALKTSVLVKLSEIIMNQQEKNSCAWVDRLHHTPVFNRWTIKSSGMGPWGVWISGQTIDYV